LVLAAVVLPPKRLRRRARGDRRRRLCASVGLVAKPDRQRAALALVAITPLVAAARLGPATAEYRGASGLAAALWA